MKNLLIRDRIKYKAFNRCSSYSIAGCQHAITYELNLMNSKQLEITIHFLNTKQA